MLKRREKRKKRCNQYGNGYEVNDDHGVWMSVTPGSSFGRRRHREEGGGCIASNAVQRATTL